MTIQQLNDKFRSTMNPNLGHVVMASNIASLDAVTIARILDAVRSYEDFDESIDPYGEHDMARFTVSGDAYYGKIDYSDRNLDFFSQNPADPKITIRVLTIMYTDEY